VTTLVLTPTLVWVIVLVLMLVTAPLVEERVVNKFPYGQVKTPPLVIQEVIVDVVKTVVVDGVVRRGVVVIEADPKVVETMADTGVDVVGLPQPSTTPSGPVTQRPRSNVTERTPDKPAVRLTSTSTPAETPALTTGLPDGPIAMSRQPLMILPPFKQVVAGMLPVTIPDDSEAEKDGMRVVAGSVEGSVTPGKGDDRADETPPSMGPAA
jgi:hypothetical protein